MLQNLFLQLVICTAFGSLISCAHQALIKVVFPFFSILDPKSGSYQQTDINFSFCLQKKEIAEKNCIKHSKVMANVFLPNIRQEMMDNIYRNMIWYLLLSSYSFNSELWQIKMASTAAQPSRHILNHRETTNITIVDQCNHSVCHRGILVTWGALLLPSLSKNCPPKMLN